MNDVHQVTIQEVARHAGVSTATVSYVVNGKKKVSAETAARVWEVINRLGYHPNVAAKLLRSAKSGIVGMIIPGFANVFYGTIANNLEKTLNRYGLSLMVVSSQENPERETELLNLMQSMQAQAVLIDPVRINFDYVSHLKGYSYPVIFFDRQPASSSFNGVYCDVRGAFRQTVGEMIDRGRKRIAIIMPRTVHSAVEERLEGYRDAFRERNMEPDPLLIIRGHGKEEDAYEFTDYAVKSLKADGLMVANRDMAVGTIRYLTTHGIRFPQDISVALLGVYDWARTSNPELTTIVEPIQAMVAQMVDLLLKTIEDSDREPNKIVLDGYISEYTSI